MVQMPRGEPHSVPDPAGAALNGALAASYLLLAGSIAKGVAKGGGYVASMVAKTAPYARTSEVRPWMVRQGNLRPGQHGHPVAAVKA